MHHAVSPARRTARTLTGWTAASHPRPCALRNLRSRFGPCPSQMPSPHFAW
jgi:hypothetical protein